MSPAVSKKSPPKPWVDETVGVALMVVGVLVALAVFTYDAGDATWFSRQPEGTQTHNLVGRVGATMAEALLQLFGVGSLLAIAALLAVAWSYVRRRPRAAGAGRAISLGALGLATCGMLDVLFGPISWGGEGLFRPGGVVGSALADGLRAILGTFGAAVVLATAMLAIVVLVGRVSPVRLTSTIGSAAARRIGAGAAGLASRLRAWNEDRRRERRRRQVLRKHQRREALRAEQRSPVEEVTSPVPAVAGEHGETAYRPSERPPIVVAPRVPARAAAPEPPAPPRQASLPLEPATGEAGYVLPPLELLREPEPQARESEGDLQERAEILTQKFQEFAVGGAVEAIHPGPVVTTFEFRPDAGVKYSKIVGLVDDLALALKAESVRVDRIPGKSTVGIEVPNRHQETIFPKDLMASERFVRSPSKLTLALGKDIGGDVYVTELDRMPHLLIAGATGAGKSVGLNGMITSVLYKATPADVRFIMIDTKMIELGLYADIPHLLIPVVTDPRHASTALKWAVREMEIRYRKLAAVGVRNIAQFNQLLQREPGRTMTNEKTGEEVPLRHLPYIVIVIDEMADLMMVSSADVEESIMRLAQMARAVGIHLILATQRPSVDVITGTIKANFPCRIAYRVSQRVDSRTIIDQQGAEHLLGRGDMLFIPPGSARLLRLHGSFITEPELNRIIAFLKRTARPSYDESVLRDPDDERAGPDGEERDEFFVRAVEVVLQEGQCSITLIQRRLRLGYARAARIVDAMERAGIVGPADGARPREVLVGPEVLQTLASEP